jgi:hypothetical protein
MKGLGELARQSWREYKADEGVSGVLSFCAE